MITVFRNTDATEDTVCTVSDDNATYSAALMGKDEIVVDVVTQAVLPVSVLDYIRYGGYAYTLNRQPEFTKEADVKYRYNLVFEGAIYNLLDKGFEHPITKQTRFTLTGTLRDFVQLAVDNANLTDSGWSVGDVPDTPRKNIVFESMTVGDVLDKLATEFSVEYHSLGKRISFYDRYENITQIVFKQGMGNGLFTLTRRNVDSENTVTRAVLYGGTKNLPLGYRNGSEYLRWADPATGNMYVENFSDYPKVVERDVYFDDVYPHFEGGLDGVRGDHHEIVRCAAIDFDVNDYMIGDVKAKINFITGDLTGNDFEFNYNHATHEVTLIRKEDDTVLPDAEGNRPLIPNDNKRPQIGDQINFTDITMPQAYVTRFENQLHDKGVEWLAINSQLRVKFELSIDHRYLRREGISLKIGDVVRIQVPEDGIDRQLRIISLEKRLKDGSITCEVSNFLRHSWEKEVEGKLMAARDKAEIIRSEVLYDLNASKEWTARHFARLAGGNRLSGDQDIEGNVKVTKDISGDNIHAEKDISAGRKISAQAGEIVDITSENIETEVLKVLEKIIAKDQTLSGKISSADFLSGLLGYGWLIDSAGRAEMHSLTLRESLDVPKLRYNRVQVIGSEMWVTEGGAISDVQSSGSQYVVTLKLEEGDPNPFRPADILKGIYHTGAGFQTVMLRVDAVSDDGAMTVTPRYPQLLPQKFMDVARIGNFTDKERQRSILISSKEGRILILGDVDGWDIQPRMVKMIFGDTSGFIHPEFGDMSGYNAFLENILMTGRIYQKSADGQTLKPVPVNKGAWEPGSYYYYDEVTRNGCLWLCTAGSTTAEPAEGSPDWIKRVDKGADGKMSYLHIKYSDDGTSFTSNNGETPGSWMGQYTDFTAEASNDFSKYTWAKVKGGDGVPGAILRSRGVWKPSEVYIRSAEFIDWVVYGAQKYRYVVKSGVATVPAGILPTNTAYWTAFNEMEPVAAPMFLGETASFDVVGSQAIRVLEDDSSEYGWMLTGGKILHTRTGLALNASGKIEAPDGLAIEMSGKSLEEWTQQKADAAKQAAIDAAAADAADKVNAVRIGSVNLIDGSEEITITAHSSQTHTYKAFPLHIRPGDEFALSVESIEILAGAPEGFTVNIVNSTYNKLLALGELTLDKRTAVYKIPENVIEQDGWFLMYAGESGKTNGVSVTYREAMLVKGNRPALTWSPSLNDQKEYSDKALDALADIANDDKLTPNEKQEAKREWDIIQGEKPILIAQADTIQLSTADYLNVYNALSAYITPLLADMTTTSTITGSVFNARFKTYYDAKTTLLKNIQYYSSGQFRITTIDATALDPDTYYPVTFTLYSASEYKATIEIGAVLGTSGKPPWATHAQGFSCNCAWESNGNRWGTLPVKRYIHSFAYSFAESTPVGSIGQVIEISMEYIYVRGGGRYTVRTSGFPFIELHPSGYHWNSGSSSGDLPTRTSIETPVVDVETAKTTAQSALGAANALSTTVTGLKNFTDSAFADGVVTRSEAAAIGKLTNQVAETAESVKAQYYNRYNHADLNETGKRNLAAKYALFDAAKAALLTSITTAIADGIATAAEQADVDAKHNAFNSALSDLNVAFGAADETIRDAIRAYADNVVDTGQNAVAKNIGFSSYEDMTAKAEAGQHIIKGGRINADLIETATLIAENLITKPASDSDQRRIEIRRETNALTAYDSAGNTVLLVKGDTVDDVNTLINPTAVSLSSDFTPQSFSWSATSEPEKYESAVCAELAVTSAGFYKISIPDIQAEHRTHCAAGAYSYGRMDFVLTTSDASDVLVQIPVAKGNTENWNTHVRAGTYTVYAKSRLYLRVRFYGRLEGYASALASESMNVKLYTASQKVTCTGSTGSAMRTSLFANGLAATYSNQEYFVVFKGGTGIPYIMGRGDTRLLSKSGKYGLRLTDSGVLATSNSTNDNNWGALMHGLVAWGIVNTGTGTIAKYWTSPAGNITALTAAAGGTGYVTITMFGSGFTSTSSYVVKPYPNNTDDRIVYASVQNKKTTSFKIGTGDGAGSVATDVVFFIFNLDTYKY